MLDAAIWRFERTLQGSLNKIVTRPLEKSEHKKAWQTAQRALQAARNVEALIRASIPSPPTGKKAFFARYGWLLRAFSVIGPLIALAGVYQDTKAEIAARDATDHSALLPFIIQNKSKFFDMTAVSASCALGSYILEDGLGHQAFAVASAGSSQATDPIKAGEQVNFPCDLRNALSLQTPFGSSKFFVTRLQTTLTVNYTIARYWHRQIKSDVFIWDRDADGFHWLRGNVMR